MQMLKKKKVETNSNSTESGNLKLIERNRFVKIV